MGAIFRCKRPAHGPGVDALNTVGNAMSVYEVQSFEGSEVIGSLPYIEDTALPTQSLIECEPSNSVRKSAEYAATQRLLLQYRKRLNEVKDFRHKAQDLRVFLRKLI
jgi:hypothetical protein